ncbi:MAG: cytochrome c3 family protein [Chloroflexota bacterium]
MRTLRRMGALARRHARLSILLVLFLVAVPTAYGVERVVHANPATCGTCHNMTSHVASYQDSSHMDAAHGKEGVVCTSCHESSLPSEIGMVVTYVTGGAKPFDAAVVKTDDAMCTKCHALSDVRAKTTQYGIYDPHGAFHGVEPACNTCHRSHETQNDYCAHCHENHGTLTVELGIPKTSPQPSAAP